MQVDVAAARVQHALRAGLPRGRENPVGLVRNRRGPAGDGFSLHRLNAVDKPEIKTRIMSYLETIVPGIRDVERVALGPSETLQFKQKVSGSHHPWKFYAAGMSDGTLRALGILTAATQLADQKRGINFVGIEEPETALHPAASGALVDALREAGETTQVVVTTHSADLVDKADPVTDAILAVQSRDGETQIAPMDQASRAAIEADLYTPGELLRMDQMDPDKADLERQREMTLFGLNGEDE